MKKQSRGISKMLPNLLFIVVFIAFGGYILSAAFNYQFKTAAFAGFTAAVLIVLSIILLVREIRRGLANAALESDNESTTANRRGIIIPLLWAVGFLAGIFLIGIVWTVPVFVFIFLIVHKGRIIAVAGSLIMWIILRFGIQMGLEANLFPGILFGGVLPRLF